MFASHTQTEDTIVSVLYGCFYVIGNVWLYFRRQAYLSYEKRVLEALPISEAPLYSKGDYEPHFYERNLTNALARGQNFLTAISGCRVARWVYQTDIPWTRKQYRYLGDCDDMLHKQLDVDRLQENDTIYVVIKSLPRFVEEELPRIRVPVVLITGQFILAPDPQLPKLVSHAILTHPYIITWFCHNPDFYNAIGIESPKLKPLAYGLQSHRYHPQDIDPATTYRQVFLQHLQPNKTILVYRAYFNPKTNLKSRSKIPNGVKKPMRDYLQGIAGAHYVISPNGDRPECYRHYEAFGLGTIPLTEMDPVVYSHFPRDSARLKFTSWSQVDGLPQPEHIANKCLVFEEYWLEDMERVVGRPLLWYDTVRQEPAFLKDFALDYSDPVVQQYKSILSG